MKSISLRALHREPPTDEVVQVTHGGKIVGTFLPVGIEATVGPTVPQAGLEEGAVVYFVMPVTATRTDPRHG